MVIFFRFVYNIVIKDRLKAHWLDQQPSYLRQEVGLEYSSKIRVNLDLRDMEEAVKPSHFPMPTPDDLRHKFAGCDTFTILDMNHAFHQLSFL